MKVRIGSTKFDLKTTSSLIPFDEDEVVGTIDGTNTIITIATCVPIQTRRQVFWHEVVHGMTQELGLDMLNTDEGFVDSFGKLLYAFHEDNKLQKVYDTLSSR